MVRMWDEDGLSIPTSMKQTQQWWWSKLIRHAKRSLSTHPESGNFTNSTPPKTANKWIKKGEKPHSKEHTALNEKNRILFLNSHPPPKLPKKRTPLTPFFMVSCPSPFSGTFAAFPIIPTAHQGTLQGMAQGPNLEIGEGFTLSKMSNVNQTLMTFHDGWFTLTLIPIYLGSTLPETTSLATENRPVNPKRKRSYSNHPFFRCELLVSGRVACWDSRFLPLLRVFCEGFDVLKESLRANIYKNISVYTLSPFEKKIHTRTSNVNTKMWTCWGEKVKAHEQSSPHIPMITHVDQTLCSSNAHKIKFTIQVP